jgi:NADPH2:quinone reductase
MRAVVVDRWMEPKDLRVSEFPEPELTRGMIKIDVKAAGCNFFDILLVKGQYQAKPEFPFVPGAEVGGIVRELGPEVDGFAVGDRVLASVPHGAFRERVAPGAGDLEAAGGMSFEEGAALPSCTGRPTRARVPRVPSPGENLLVHAAAGGVGIAAVQIGKALARG